jgi:sterol desaturase/sphingolipid hydroxylase (fatty acid hydroxylase superfamily)
MIGRWHLFFAVCFFITLAIFALVLFRKTDPNGKPTRQKQQRNVVYLICGITIVVCLALMILIHILPISSWLQPFHVIFWLESLGILTFGIAWFVKGETILKDG